MTSRVGSSDVLAYVDNCLDPAERRMFEARLREDSDLRRQVALWESQNRAIRRAYGAAASARAALELGASSNENLPVWMASAIQSRRSAAPPRATGEAHARPARASSVAGEPTPSAAPRALGWAVGRRVAALLALTAGLIVAGAPGGARLPQNKLIDAGLAAYRAFAAAPSVPVEFRTGDPKTLANWLTPQFARGIVVPQFSSDALTLIGGRIAPGTTASAAFLVYEDRSGERVGLLIEPFDAPAPSKPALRESDGVSLAAWTGAGHGFVVAGPSPGPVVALTRLVEEAAAPAR